MRGRIIRGYLKAGTRQIVSDYSPVLLRMPVHEERTQEFCIVLNQPPEAFFYVRRILCANIL